MATHLRALLERPVWWSLPELGDELRRAHGIETLDTGIAATMRKMRRKGIFVRCRRRDGNLYEYTIGASVSPGEE
jgi:hypothetical protein